MVEDVGGVTLDNWTSSRAMKQDVLNGLRSVAVRAIGGGDLRGASMEPFICWENAAPDHVYELDDRRA